MADINSEIKVNIDTSSALSSIKALQSQISAFHTELTRGGAAANAASAQMTQNLINTVNATGKFNASIKTVKTTTESFTNALEKNKLSFGEYFRYAGASSKSFGKMFKQEFETINKVARERVKDLQTQYIQLGRDANGAMRSIAVRPLTLDMNDLGTKTAIAAQRQQLLNQLLKQGSTNLLNFGKNTQWAGRQLMVGFTIPLGILGSTAAKTFMQMEEQAIKFKRVYGDSFTATEETDKMLNQIKELASEFTKYGVAITDTMEIAASAAATGKTGADLTAQVAEATRLAVLGGVEQSQALETTISLTNAFGTAADQLRGKINFLNAVENQTVTSIEDLTIAIPKAGPVVEQLGGEVEDLAYFLTAMREGGINASEGANALKSGLAAMINPTGKAKEMLMGLGINLQKIVETNKGDVKGTVVEFAKALDTLDPLDRSKAIEQLFGKFQFARISTLFKNVIAEGSQANRVLQLTNASSTELAVLANKELGRIEASPMFKFQKAVADFQAQLAPVGEQFLKAVTPIIEFGTKVLESFNKLDEGVKGAIVNITGIVAGIGPVLLMTFGLIANGVANVIKGFAFIKNVFNRASTASTVLGETTNYMTQEQLEAAAVAASLEQTHNRLTQAFTSEKGAIDGLTAAYRRAVAAQQAFNGPITPGGPLPKPKGFANGGMIMGPGSGTSDSIPAMVSNGEFIVNAKRTKQYLPLLQAIAAGKVPGFVSPEGGTEIGGGGSPRFNFVPPGSTSQSTTTSINQILDGIESGAIKIEQSQEVVSRTLADVANETKVSLKQFFQRLAVNAEEVTGQSISNQVNTFYQKEMGRRGRAIRYSASGVGTIQQQMADAGRSDELDRAKKRLEAEAALGLPGQLQIDRAHRVEVGTSGKMFPEAWQSEAFNPQTHSENAVSNALSGDNRTAGFFESYSKELKNLLDEGIIDQEEYNSILEKAKRNLALSEKELGTQAKVLKRVVKNDQDLLKRSPALSNDIQRTIAGAQTPGGLAVNTNAGQITVEAEKAVTEQINAAKTGMTNGFNKATKRNSPPQEAIDAGEDYGNALNSGAQSKTDDATQAGKDLAQAQINGASSVPVRRSGKRVTTDGPIDPSAPIVMPTTQSGKRRRVRTSGDVVPNADGGYDVVPENTAPDARTARSKKDVQKEVRKRMGGAKYRAAQAKRSITPGRASGAGFVASGALAMGAGMVGGPVGEAMGAASGVLSVISMFGGTLSKIIPIIIRFAGPIGIAIGVITTLIGVVSFLTEGQRKAAQQAKDMADATKVTTDEMKGLGDFFGVTVKDRGYFSAKSAPDANGKTTDQTAVEELKKTGTFKKDFKSKIAAVKNGTAEQAKLVLQNLQVALASDFAPEQVSLIVEAIKQEAGKTDLKLDFAALDFSTKEGAASAVQNIQANINAAAGQANDVKGTTTNITSGMYGTGEVVGTATSFSEEEKAKIATFTNVAKTSLGALRAAYDDGKVSLEQYTLGMNAFKESMKKAAIETPTLFKQSFNSFVDGLDNLDDGKKRAIKNLKGVEQQLLAMELAAINAADAAAYAVSVFAITGGRDVADLDGRSAKRLMDLEKKYKAKLKANKKSTTTTGGTTTGGGNEGGLTTGEQKSVEKYQKGLDIIERQEKAINEKYDKRIKALDAVAKANAEISQQQKDQLDLADALSRGDIAAAARAAQTMRANEAQANIDREKDAMDRARQAEIDNIKDPLGRTKATLIALIDAIQAKADTRDFNRLNRASGGMIPKYFANGGTPLGSDIVPAMLTPGEFVVKKSAVANFGAGKLKAINEGTYSGESVYNYNINVNVNSSANPDAIARTVMAQIKNVDSQRLRGNRI